MNRTAHHQAFVRKVREIANRHERWRVFADFCELSALALANGFPHLQREAFEQQYLDVVRRYDADEARGMAQLLAITTDGLETPCDFLGEVFTELELGNKWRGQVFTPYPVSRLMAELVLADAPALLERQEFITVQEPAVGGGGLVIGIADWLAEKGVNYQQRIHVTAVDVDQTAAYMAYIQFSLLGIPAIVHVGNTLSMELRQVLRTPMHHLGLWEHKLRRGPRQQEPTPTIDLGQARQGDLFEPDGEGREEAVLCQR